LENDRGVHIGNVGGDVIGVGVAGSGNVIGKNIVINKQQLENMPSEYAESLTKFIEEFKKYNIPPEQVKPIQDSLNDVTKEVEGIKTEEKMSTVKQKNINSKFSIFAEKVLKVLPKTVETVSAFTPLAPFSKLIGEGVQQLVEAIQREM
jgi:archaellum component FlaC